MKNPGWLLLVPLLFACASSPSQPGAPAKREVQLKGRTRMTQEQLREELEALCSHIIRTVKTVSDRIDQEAQDPDLRRKLMLWRIDTFRFARQTLDTKNSSAGLIDIWASSQQFLDYVQTDRAKERFGAQQPIALEAARAIESLIEHLADDFFAPEALEEVRAGVEEFAREHPMTVLARRQLRVSIAAEAEDLPWFSRFTGLAATTQEVHDIGREIDQITWMLEWMPSVARWETRILLLDAAKNPLVTGLAEDINRATLTLERFEKQTAEMPKVIRQEITIALDEIDKKQTEVRKTLKLTQDLIKDGRGTVEEVRAIMETIDKTMQSRPELFAAVEDTTKSLTTLSDSLQPTVKEVRGLLADMETEQPGPKEGQAPGDNSLATVERTSRELTASTTAIHASLVELRELLRSDDLNQRLGGAGETARDLISYLFWRAVAFVVIAVAAVVAGALVYRRLRSGA